ncbi:MAG: flagellar biosynthesis protein FliO [Xanthobacteraceae bacterium]|nr:flagellar biosynthesis protein FliO [Xanthobacteraceae bacterium]
MSNLLGVELPTPVSYVIAFVFVLLLIGAAAAWLVRRFGATRLDAASRGRQPRLAVMDSAAVDGRRKLVIIRRDNVEHLLMIGGPSDVVVETNIVRGAADKAWQTTPAEPAVTAPPVPEVRPVRPADTLAGLAEELARPEPAAAARTIQVPQQAQPPRNAPPMSPAMASAPQANPAADQSLAEMAQRLEAALRRPMAQKVVAETQRVTATVEIKAGTPKAAVQPRNSTLSKPQGDLEQEMASLLSRPGKT